jgi:transcriptional regulator with XRE-family HTH domain
LKYIRENDLGYPASNTKYNMKQPELGRKISELRKAKGWTQEELVEKCNISVRTIQRIETGEVMPRTYTVKTIFGALDYELDKVFAEDRDDNSSGNKWHWLDSLTPNDVKLKESPDFLVNQLNVAWIFGVVYFILSFVEGPVEYLRFTKGEMLIGIPAYVVMKTCLLVAVIFFLRGFIVVGVIYNNYLLKIISMVLIGAHALLIFLDIASLSFDSVEREAVLVGAALLFGAIGIVYGIALRRLGHQLGRVAKFAAGFEFAAACLFLSVIFGFVGDVVHIPAELFEIIILFKVIERMKAKEMAHNIGQGSLG